MPSYVLSQVPTLSMSQVLTLSPFVLDGTPFVLDQMGRHSSSTGRHLSSIRRLMYLTVCYFRYMLTPYTPTRLLECTVSKPHKYLITCCRMCVSTPHTPPPASGPHSAYIYLHIYSHIYIYTYIHVRISMYKKMYYIYTYKHSR